MFTQFQKLSNQTNYSVEQFLPFKDFFLPEYSCLEKILVVINITLFCASLSDENLDQEVGTAILYIMFAIAYFVTTTTCLSGANALKRKACIKQISEEGSKAGPDSETQPSKSGLSISTPSCNFVPNKSFAGNSQKTANSKKHATGKRGNDQRKNLAINTLSNEKSGSLST